MKKLLAFSFCALLAGCGAEQANKTQAEDILNVTTTIYPITYFTEVIGGEYVSVTPLLKNGADAHSFEPTIQQLASASNSDLFFYVDEITETFMPKILPNLEADGVKAIGLAQNIDDHDHDHDDDADTHDRDDAADTHDHDDDADTHDHDDDADTHDHDDDADTHDHDDDADTHDHDDDADTHDHDDDADIHDHDDDADIHDHDDDADIHDHDDDCDHDHEHNHAWLYPPYAKQMAEGILDQLTELMPEHEAEFKANYEDLVVQFDELDNAFKTLSAFPTHHFIVTHAAYGLWENYNVHQLPITGILGNDEPTQKELIALIEEAKEKEISYLYYELNIPSSYGDLIQDELKLTPLELHNVASLTNEQVKNEENYFTLMYQNIENIKKELSE